MRDSAALAGIVKRAKGLLAVPEDFFAHERPELLPVANGMLRLSDRSLLSFSPSYRCRHKLAVHYDAGACCPQFEGKLLMPALSVSDIALIQRWAGLALLGVNLSQKILLLTGTPGGGKSTLVSVLTGIIGKGNVGMLRTEHLGDRFEIGRLSGKTLLYGPDVAEDFLTKTTASGLKSLTGGDVMTACVEAKNLEEEGDAIYHEALGKLFDTERNAIELIKWKEIYDNLERTLDQAEDVANVLESITLKHG